MLQERILSRYTAFVKTLLLLAGRSRRFWPLREKSLFPICGKTLLEHQMERLHAGGCKDITLVGGAHNLEAIRSRFPELPTIEQENLNLGMRGACLSALPRCGDGPVMIVSSNDVIDPLGYRMLRKFRSDGAILAQRVKTYFPGGYLILDNQNRITGIVEKPGEGKAPSDLVNIVAHVHRNPAALLKALQSVDGPCDDGYEQALAKLLKTHTYDAVLYDGAWQAIKYPWHLLQLLPVLLGEIDGPCVHRRTSVHRTAIIEGNVVIGEGTRVFANACIIGPCTIGRNCIIGNNALVREASIGDNCVIGYNTEVKSSVLGENVWLHMNYIGDSIIGSNVGFGSGTVTGNLRLDEQETTSFVDGKKTQTGLRKFGTVVGNDSRIGIHVGINPGVKIGAGSFVSSKVLVSSDVPDGAYATMRDGILEIRKNREGSLAPGGRKVFRAKL